jgi:septal ring factor EnvC (AmiA/AmiB activator)
MDEARAQLDEVIRRFLTAEEALNAVLSSAGLLREASAQLADARTDVQRAETNLQQQEQVLRGAEHSLDETRSAVYDLTRELKGIAREMKDAARAFQALEPEAWRQKLEAQAKAESQRLEDLLRGGLSALESRVDKTRRFLAAILLLLVLATLAHLVFEWLSLGR